MKFDGLNLTPEEEQFVLDTLKIDVRSMKKKALTLLSVLSLCSPAAAQSSSAEQIKQVIATCIAVVRGLPEEYRNQYHTFDAYLNGQGTIDRWATPEGDFQFNKCMAGQGVTFTGGKP
jgi:hypothetical protein